MQMRVSVGKQHATHLRKHSLATLHALHQAQTQLPCTQDRDLGARTDRSRKTTHVRRVNWSLRTLNTKSMSGKIKKVEGEL